MFHNLIASFTEPDFAFALGALLFCFVVTVILYILPDPKKPIFEYLHTSALFLFALASLPITLPVLVLLYFLSKKQYKDNKNKISTAYTIGKAEGLRAGLYVNDDYGYDLGGNSDPYHELSFVMSGEKDFLQWKAKLLNKASMSSEDLSITFTQY